MIGEDNPPRQKRFQFRIVQPFHHDMALSFFAADIGRETISRNFANTPAKETIPENLSEAEYNWRRQSPKQKIPISNSSTVSSRHGTQSFRFLRQIFGRETISRDFANTPAKETSPENFSEGREKKREGERKISG
ncbi:hypothetical protein CEXT_599801 [Caerostris extrusa]|uniref:Uncharacterized protein n=1 Tax=Caerostris extrusa TaxID=172846 RepID=A0AAV4MFD8_CAEEX|nr:hypothetical protein CEXT_599801 [Caerostris extrusa]